MTSRENTFSVASAAQSCGLTQHQVRVYLDMSLVRPCATTDSGFRLFDAHCLQRLALIKACRDAGLSLSEIAGFVRGLDGDDPTRCREVEGVLRARIRDKHRALTRCARPLAMAAARS